MSLFKTNQNISYESSELIEELKQDILEFGEDHPCILVYKKYKGKKIYTNYDFIVPEKPFNPKEELQKGEKYVKSTLKEALELFEKQNRVI